MVHEGKLWMIDFQDARMGPLSYDVVSLLWDPYVQIDDQRRSDLLAFWKKGVLKTAQGLQMSRVLEVFASPVESAASFECELERMKVQRLLKAAGSYASCLNLKRRKDYLPSIRPGFLSAREALQIIVSQTKWKCVEDERLLTLVNNYIQKESELH
jgi:aminoglycoside/choline kinase family phosphotransferase